MTTNNPSDNRNRILFDNKNDDSSSNIIFGSKTSNSTMNGTENRPKDGDIGKILATLHLEWSRHEIEKNRWIADRAEYESKIAILEGRIKSYANINNELLQRIKMLEAALLVARSQKKYDNESCISNDTQKNMMISGEYEPPIKSIFTNEQSKRGRNLLQQYLKEIQIIEDTIKIKHVTDSKIAEYLSKTTSDSISIMSTPHNPFQSGYDSTNYYKTFGHSDPKKKSTHQMSTNEQSKFLDDMKKTFKNSVNERRKNFTSDEEDLCKALDENIFREFGEIDGGDDDDVDDQQKHLKLSNKNIHQKASNLFDMLKTIGDSNNASTSSTLSQKIDSTTNTVNDYSRKDQSLNYTSNNIVKKNDDYVASFDHDVDVDDDDNDNLSGGVIRKKDLTNKKSNRIKMDMFNFVEKDFTGTGVGICNKKTDAPSSLMNIFSKQSINKTNDKDINEQFESKLDILAKRFNIGGSSNDSSSSSTSTVTSSNLSSAIIDTSETDSINSLNIIASSNNTLDKDDVDDDDDLGILNSIDDIIANTEETSSTSFINTTSTVSNERIQKRWNISNILRGHTDCITCTNFHPTEKIAISSSYDGMIYLWKYDKQKSDIYPTSFLRGHEYPVLYCLFNSIGDCLYSCDNNGNIFVWNIIDNPSVLQQYKSHNEAIWYMSYNHSSNTLLSASADGICSFWKPDSHDAISTFNIDDPSRNSKCGIICADFSPLDHSKIIISSGDTIYMYDANQEKTIFSLKNNDNNYIDQNSSSSGLIQCASLHPQDNIYATGWGHNQVKIIDLKSGEFVKQFNAHPAPITAISYGSGCSGTYLATGGANGSIHIWNQNYSCYQDLPPHRVKHHSGISSLVFHSNFPHMITGGADELIKMYI